MMSCRDCVREAIKRENINLGEIDRKVLGTSEEKVAMPDQKKVEEAEAKN